MKEPSTENPDFILPIALRDTTVQKALKVLRNKHKVEITSGSRTYQDFVLDRKNINFGTCTKLSYPECKCDGDTCNCIAIISTGSIPYHLHIEYVGIVNKAILYIQK